jgi:long-subunit fatty acid transport protein
MKKQLAIALSIAVTGAVQAGGIERTSQSVGILFEVGRYAEFSIGSVSPKVSGVFAHPAGGISSGNMASNYTSLSLGYKQPIGKNIDVALIIDQPVGADVSYPTSATGYPLAGSKATLNSTAYTGLMRYKFPSNVSLIGGFRLQSLGGKVDLPAGPYELKVAQDKQLGYVAGIAYEKPEIALRASLTYNSEIKHTFNDVVENNTNSVPFSTTIPKSVNLEFKSGVAKDTLVFGSVRWVEWSKFDITPYGYANPPAPATQGNSLTDLKNDKTTYSLGVGRRLSDKWSAAVSLGYEAASGGISGNLAPTDGSKSIGVGVSYKMKKAKITAGVRYVKIGDATTEIGPLNSNFKDNSAIGFGVKVGYTF